MSTITNQTASGFPTNAEGGLDIEGQAGQTNRLNGSNGDDNYLGKEGRDIFACGLGDDEALGGSGNDFLSGGLGDDVLTGGAGIDRLEGGVGEDVLSGGADMDFLRGGFGDDVLSGGSGNDSLYGDAGADILSGGAGNDYLEGGAGEDFLSGGQGNDFLSGGNGNDTLRGGAGADVFVFNANANAANPNGFTDTGVDTVTDYDFSEGDVLKILGASNASYNAQTGIVSVDGKAVFKLQAGLDSSTLKIVDQNDFELF